MSAKLTNMSRTAKCLEAKMYKNGKMFRGQNVQERQNVRGERRNSRLLTFLKAEGAGGGKYLIFKLNLRNSIYDHFFNFTAGNFYVNTGTRILNLKPLEIEIFHK